MNKRIQDAINRRLWLLKCQWNKIMYHDLNGEKTGISVISCNCTGGCVMKEYNMRFMSPTINLAIGAADFLKFCQNLRYYTSLAPSLALEPIQSTQTYPLIMLGVILIHAIHYDSFDNFCEAWNRRVSRINFDKLFYIFSDRDGFTVELLQEIDKLETPKVMFAKEKYDDYSSVVYELVNSARLIGASELSKQAHELENAGREGDIALIKEKTDDILKKYQYFYDRFDRLFKK